MPNLLFVSHTPSPNTRKLRDSCLQAMRHPELDNLQITCKSFLETQANDVLACDGILLGTTENFAYMAGLTKDFFERIYYPCLEKTQGLAYALYIRAGQDGQGSQQSIERITTGLKWKATQATLILQGSYQAAFEQRVADLALNFAAGIDAGL